MPNEESQQSSYTIAETQPIADTQSREEQSPLDVTLSNVSNNHAVKINKVVALRLQIEELQEQQHINRRHQEEQTLIIQTILDQHRERSLNITTPAPPLIAQGGNPENSDSESDSGEDGLTSSDSPRGSARELLSRDHQIDTPHSPIIVQLQNSGGDRRGLRPPIPYLGKNLEALRTFQREYTNWFDNDKHNYRNDIDKVNFAKTYLMKTPAKI